MADIKNITIDGTTYDLKDAKAREDVSDLKEDIKDNYAKNDGYYDGMTVGNAEQIVGTVFEEDDTAYNYRTTGGSAEVGDRAYVESITGGSLVWNQLVTNGNFANGTSGWFAASTDVTISAANNILTASIEAGTATSSYKYGINQNVTALKNYDHKFLFGADVTPSESCKFQVQIHGGYGNYITPSALSAGTKARVECVITSSAYFVNNFTIYPVLTGTIPQTTIQYTNIVCFDLTAMFGSTIADYIYSLETAHAGDGVAWFRRYFPKDYYAYHAVGMEHVNAVAAKTVGFNQWDEEWEHKMGYSTGDMLDSASNIASKNYIPVLPNTSYYLNRPSGVEMYMYKYDADKNYLGLCEYLGNNIYNTGDAKYIKFATRTDNYSGNYNHDICISIRWDNSRDGDYEPYNLHTYPLADLTLRGIPLIDESGNLYFDGDRYLPDGTVERRYGIVDLGTLRWYDETTSGVGFFASPFSDFSSNVPKTGNNMSCPKYVTTENSVYSTADKHIDTVNYNFSGGQINVFDSAYSSASDFKTAMSGVYLVYELATPTTEEADPYQYPMVVDNWGTEELIDGLVESGDRDVAIPVGHETKYPPNLKDKLESAANNPDADGAYILTHDGGSNTYTPLASNATIQNIIARLEALEGGGENE